MKHLITAVFMIAALTSCKKENVIGNGNTLTELRPLTGFTRVEVEGSTDVTVSQGSTFKVEVKAYSNLLPQLETKVVNGVLKIVYKTGTSVSNDNSEVTITMPALTKFIASGSSKVDIASGSADNFEAVILGSANIHAFGFTAKDARITIEGSGDAKLSVTEKLYARITGSGTVYYKGNASVTSDITGSGKVVKQ
jgi:hypothetical protein